MSVERVQGGLQRRGQTQRVERLCLAAPLLRHLRADVLPQVAEHRHVVARDVVGDWHTRQLDDPAFDGVHEGEVTHRPREQRSFGVARATEEERRCGEVHHPRYAKLALDSFKSGNPEPCGLVILLGFLFVVALQVLDLVYIRLLAVTVMRLVIEHEDVLQAHQAGHHPLDHLSFGFQRIQLLPATLEQGSAALGKLDALAKLEGVVVGDDDLGAIDVLRACRREPTPGLCSSCPGRWAAGREAGL